MVVYLPKLRKPLWIIGEGVLKPAFGVRPGFFARNVFQTQAFFNDRKVVKSHCHGEPGSSAAFKQQQERCLRSRLAERGRRVLHGARCASTRASSTGCNSPRSCRCSSRGGLYVGGLLEQRGAAEACYRRSMAAASRFGCSEGSRSSCAARGLPGCVGGVGN